MVAADSLDVLAGAAQMSNDRHRLIRFAVRCGNVPYEDGYDSDEPPCWCPVENRECDDELCADYGCARKAGMVPDRRSDWEPPL